MSGNFIVYLVGYIIGVGYGLSAAGVGRQWILAVVLVMVGLGIVYALSRSQQDKEVEKSVRRRGPDRIAAKQSAGAAATGPARAAAGRRRAALGPLQHAARRHRPDGAL